MKISNGFYAMEEKGSADVFTFCGQTKRISKIFIKMKSGSNGWAICCKICSHFQLNGAKWQHFSWGDKNFKFQKNCVCFVFLFLFSSFAAKHPAFSIKGLATLKVIFVTNMKLGSRPCVYTTRIFFNFWNWSIRSWEITM